MINTKSVNGFLWPQEDVGCASVVFEWLEHLDLALKHVAQFDVAVQAGGNCGVWPKRLGREFRTVYTFEPEPRNFYCLAHNCPEENIIKLQAAVGAYEESPMGIDFPAGERNLGAARMWEEGQYPVIAIDQLHLELCDLIQLDVEGYEPIAIMGAFRTIKRCRPVIMVEDKGLSDAYGYPKGWSENYPWLSDLGYRVAEKAIRDVVLVCDD